jgi:peptidoglycan biosynthesis protein MviN/MurJ (putative lipid II flippase)
MKRGVVLGIVASANLLFSFAFQWLLLTSLGPGRQTDAYFAAVIIPQITLSVVVGALVPVLVPLLATQSDEDYRRVGWAFLHLVAAVFGTLAVILGATAGYWVPLVYPGFEAATRMLTVELVRIQLVAMVVAAMAAVPWAMNHARQRFVWAETCPVIGGALALVALRAGLRPWGPRAAAWASVLESAAQLLLLTPILRPYVRPRLAEHALHEAWRRLRPMLGSTLFYKSDRVVDRYLASLAGPGGLSLIHLAQQICAGGLLIVSKAISAPLVPQLALDARQAEWVRFRRQTRRALGLAVAVSTAGVIAVWLVGEPLLTLIFAHGRFDPARIADLRTLLIALAGMAIGGSAGSVAANAFYAQGETRLVAMVGITGFVVGALTKVLAAARWGILGVAVGASVHYLTIFLMLQLLLIARLRRRCTSSAQRALAEA